MKQQKIVGLLWDHLGDINIFTPAAFHQKKLKRVERTGLKSSAENFKSNAVKLKYNCKSGIFIKYNSK